MNAVQTFSNFRQVTNTFHGLQYAVNQFDSITSCYISPKQAFPNQISQL